MTYVLDVNAVEVFAKEVRTLAQRYEAADAQSARVAAVAIAGGDWDPWEAWDTVDRMVANAGRIADILWPAQRRGHAIPRGRQLRQEFGLAEDSPLALRDARNSAEHFAERLDTFIEARSTSWAYSSLSWGATAGVKLPEGAEQTGRRYETTSGIAYVFGDPIDLRQVGSEIARVDRYIERWLQRRSEG